MSETGQKQKATVKGNVTYVSILPQRGGRERRDSFVKCVRYNSIWYAWIRALRGNWLFWTLWTKVPRSVSRRSGVEPFKILFIVTKTSLGEALQPTWNALDHTVRLNWQAGLRGRHQLHVAVQLPESPRAFPDALQGPSLSKNEEGMSFYRNWGELEQGWNAQMLPCCVLISRGVFCSPACCPWVVDLPKFTSPWHKSAVLVGCITLQPRTKALFSTYSLVMFASAASPSPRLPSWPILGW